GQYIAKSRRLEPAMFDKLFAEMSEYFYIQSQLNNLVLTIDGFTLGGLLAMYPAYGGANQLWTWGPNDTLVSKMGLVADVSGVNRDAGAECIGYFPNGGVNQKWIYRNGQIVSIMNNLVLDIQDGDTTVSTPVQMWQDNGTLQQKWSFVSESEISSEIFGAPDLAGR
ncbi:unnamed protein product, partial [Porites lobata]